LAGSVEVLDGVGAQGGTGGVCSHLEVHKEGDLGIGIQREGAISRRNVIPVIVGADTACGLGGGDIEMLLLIQGDLVQGDAELPVDGLAAGVPQAVVEREGGPGTGGGSAFHLGLEGGGKLHPTETRTTVAIHGIPVIALFRTGPDAVSAGGSAGARRAGAGPTCFPLARVGTAVAGSHIAIIALLARSDGPVSASLLTNRGGSGARPARLKLTEGTAPI